jgi:hypothetical protein
MNWKKLIWLTYVVSTVFAVSTAVAAQRATQIGPMHPAARSSAAHAPMMANPSSAFHRFNNGGRDRNHRFSRFGRFNDGDNDFDDRFRRFHRFNEVIVFNDFGFPFASPFFYPYPYYYPYGYYDYNQPVYGSAYGGASIVVEVQSRLARAGYYHGAIDGVMGRQTRYAIRAYERAHNMRVDGAISRQLLGTMGLHY